MIAVERFDMSRHWALLNSWMVARGSAQGMGDPDCYPTFGLVVGGIVAGFLFLTDAPGLAWLGSIVSDPGPSTEHRRAALRVLVGHLLDEARRQRVRSVVSFPGPEPLAQIMAGAGFDSSPRPHRYMRVDLERLG